MDLSEIYKTDHGDLSGMTILLLEKDGAETQKIEKLLVDCDRNYSVINATTLDEAIDTIRREYLDVVIFNLSYAGPDSLAALIQPALDLKKPYVLIAVVDAGDDALGKEAAKKGAEDYLLKDELDTKLLGKSINQSIKCHHLRHRNINLSLVDKVTGLLSRRGFIMLAEQEMKVAQRYGRKMFLLFAEVVELEERRERLGPVGYEDVLRESANILRHSLRGADILTSLENGSFAGFVVGDPEESRYAIGLRLRDNLKELNSRHIIGFKLELNMEFVLFDDEAPQSIEEMMKEAEDKMAKKRKESK